MSKTPHIQCLCDFARHGKPLYHSKFIETISSLISLHGIKRAERFPTFLYFIPACLHGTTAIFHARLNLVFRLNMAMKLSPQWIVNVRCNHFQRRLISVCIKYAPLHLIPLLTLYLPAARVSPRFPYLPYPLSNDDTFLPRIK